MLQLVIIRKCNHEDKSAITVEGTRAFYYFKPAGATRLGMKRISDDKQFSLETDIISSREDIPTQNTNIGQYVSVLYDDNWYIGIVQHIDKTRAGHCKFKLNSATANSAKLQEVFRNRKSASLR